MKIVPAEKEDCETLYEMQLLAFQSEAQMIGSHNVPALLETREDHEKDFSNWHTLKLVDEDNKILGSIRYKPIGEWFELGRLMVLPKYRHKGLAQRLILEAEKHCENHTKELSTCTKSWSNIRLYEKMGYKAYTKKEWHGLSFVYMKKD